METPDGQPDYNRKLAHQAQLQLRHTAILQYQRLTMRQALPLVLLVSCFWDNAGAWYASTPAAGALRREARNTLQTAAAQVDNEQRRRSILSIAQGQRVNRERNASGGSLDAA